MSGWTSSFELRWRPCGARAGIASAGDSPPAGPRFKRGARALHALAALCAGALALVGAGGTARAQAAGAGGWPGGTALARVLSESTLRIDLRARMEYGRQGALGAAAAPEDSLSSTGRLRLGLLTGVYRGLQGYAELEHTRAVDRDRYNAAPGQHGHALGDPGRVVVADPESSELNQAWLSYASPLGRLRLGRQRIALDEHRFIGDVGFRQNEQTYDAAVLALKPRLGIELYYAWIYGVNRIFGSHAGDSPAGSPIRDFDSRSHVLQLSYPTGRGSLRAYAHLLDLQRDQTVDGGSSDTLGASWTGRAELAGAQLAYRGEYARQLEAGHARVDYRADYHHLRASATLRGFTLGADREVLGGDRRAQDRASDVRAPAAFQTPLATLHAFNGFADLFLTTPSNGLIDDQLFATLPLPQRVRADLSLHRYRSSSGGLDYGREIDAVLRCPLPGSWTGLIQLASYRARDRAPNIPLRDTLRLTVQLEYRLN